MQEDPRIDSPQDWQEFTEAKPHFSDLIAKWRRFMALLIIKTPLTDGDSVGELIVAFMTTSIMDVDDLLLLTVHDKHVGAHKILRSLFERVVTLKFIAENFGTAERFLGYDAIDWMHVIDGINATVGLTLPEPALSNLQQAARKAKLEYKGEPCPTCGLRKQTSWSSLSIKDMALRTDLGHMHLHAYLTPSKLIHPTYWGTKAAISRKSAMYNTLNYLHEIIVHLILLHRRHFVEDRTITPIMSAAVEDFLSIWIFAETSFGGMLGERPRPSRRT